MKGTTKEQRRKKDYALKDLPTLTRVKRKRVNNSPIEKPHLKNIEQTSQKWVLCKNEKDCRQREIPSV